MARTSGNAAPSGFAAGQLRDGKEIMLLDWYENSLGSGAQVVWAIRTRYYKETLILEYQIRVKTSGAVRNDWRIGTRDLLNNIAIGDAPANVKYQELADSLPYAATQAQITSLLGAGVELVPVAPTSSLIPFEADADGRIKPYSAPVDQNKVLQTLANTQQQITNSLTGTTGTSTTGTGTTGTNNTVRNVLIVTAVISVLVIVGIVVVKALKK